MNSTYKAMAIITISALAASCGNSQKAADASSEAARETVLNEISGPGLPDPGAPPSTQDGKYVKPSEAELRQILTPLQFEVTQKNGTEPAFANMYVDNHAEGIYVDVVSGEPLFSSRDKFDSGTGWPSFTRPLIAANLVEKQDMSYGMARVEVRSLYADSHLGHLFDDGPAPTGLRYCMNSAALRFIPVADLEKEGYGRFARLFTDEAVAGAEDGRDASIFPDPPPEPLSAASEARTAVLAGGCFWGMEGVFERLTGVIDVVTGYSGGTADTARYEIVGKGITGHAEAIQVTYDPSRISYGTLLKVFFSLAHNPTELDFQGPDVGAQYRSAIFYADEDQKRTAEAYIEILEAASIFDLPIVTEVTSLEAFYTAEKYHQDFMRRNPDYPYIVCWDAPKVKELLDRYPELVDPSRR